MSGGSNTTPAGILMAGIERIEGLLAERKQLNDEISAAKNALKGQGFDKKVVEQMLKERKMDASDREEFQAVCELYRAALGMLGGTPLGEAARRRMMGEKPKDADDEDEGGEGGGEGEDTVDEADNDAPAPGEDGEEQAPASRSARKKPKADGDGAPGAAIGPAELDAAKQAGRDAAAAGKSVYDNPYTANDPRRALWDEGWCLQTGSDGMDVPDAWRRKKPKKDGKGGGGDQ